MQKHPLDSTGCSFPFLFCFVFVLRVRTFDVFVTLRPSFVFVSLLLMTRLHFRSGFSYGPGQCCRTLNTPCRYTSSLHRRWCWVVTHLYILHHYASAEYLGPPRQFLFLLLPGHLERKQYCCITRWSSLRMSCLCASGRCGGLFFWELADAPRSLSGLSSFFCFLATPSHRDDIVPLAYWVFGLRIFQLWFLFLLSKGRTICDEAHVRE